MTQSRSMTMMKKAFLLAASIMIGVLIGLMMQMFANTHKAEAFESECITISQPKHITYKLGEPAYIDYTVLDPYSDPNIQAFVYLRLYIDGKLDGKEILMGAVEKGSYVMCNATTSAYMGQAAPYITTYKPGTYKLQIVCKPYNIAKKKFDTSIKASAYPTKTVTFKVSNTGYKGLSFNVPKYGKFKVTTTGKEVAFVAPASKTAKSVTVPATVTYYGKTYKVTSVAGSALKNNTKVKSVTVGSNVKSIGAKAFYGAKNLKTITVKSKVLKNVGTDAIKNINKKATIKVPSGKKAAYKKLFNSKGLVKTMKVK